MTPEQVAAEVLGCDSRLLSGERIKSGLTNQSWRIRGAGHDVVVRLSTADERALQLDRVSEARVLRVVEQAGIGAQVIVCAPHSRLLITHTLPGRNWYEHEAHAPNNIARLAALVRQLHALPIPEDVHRIDLKTALHGYWSELDARAGDGGELSDEQIEQRTRALHLAQVSLEQPQLCLCHTDVHHLNLIDDGARLWLLDWEYAGIGDRYFDLASICCFHHYDDATRRALLQQYFGEVTEQSITHLDHMCWLFDYIKALWFAVRSL